MEADARLAVRLLYFQRSAATRARRNSDNFPQRRIGDAVPRQRVDDEAALALAICLRSEILPRTTAAGAEMTADGIQAMLLSAASRSRPSAFSAVATMAFASRPAT